MFIKNAKASELGLSRTKDDMHSITTIVLTSKSSIGQLFSIQTTKEISSNMAGFQQNMCALYLGKATDTNLQTLHLLSKVTIKILSNDTEWNTLEFSNHFLVAF